MARTSRDFAWTVQSKVGSNLARGPSEATLGEALAARLVEEMGQAWRAGERRQAEEYLAQHPELCNQAQAGVRVVYEEICLREDQGEMISPQEYYERFPQWRSELEVVLDCHNLIQSPEAGPRFPEVGETLGDFKLLAVLGRGIQGRVFLASQPALADRPVVLKVSPRDAREHLSLARLVHTHIVPLYAVHEFAERDLRSLCMPYLGGTTLADILEELSSLPVQKRNGRDILIVLDRAESSTLVPKPASGPARQFLAQATYVQAMCWIGSCLAEALHYAHERGLVHLDIKPANVLLASDGQPMLLDFHLAREPILPDGAVPEWLGGTPLYMSPEQEIALAAVRDQRPIPRAVDGRSDIYSLGMLLYEALGGSFPVDVRRPASLHRQNRQVSAGLADLLHKCMAHRPADRYQDAAALAADLRHHLADEPLLGVANRSWSERWRKWRSRRPHALSRLGLGFGILLAILAVALVIVLRVEQRLSAARTASTDGQSQLDRHRYSDAVSTLKQGLANLEGVPGIWQLRDQITRQLTLAQGAQRAEELHHFVDSLRFLYGLEGLSRDRLLLLEQEAHRRWLLDCQLLDNRQSALDTDRESVLRLDLLDLAILWSDLSVRVASPSSLRAAQAEALQVLQDAEALFGTSIVLMRERESYARSLGMQDLAAVTARRASQAAARSAWEHYALGRFQLRSGELGDAAASFERALKLQPGSFWSHFYKGVCAYRLRRYDDAILALSICVALDPRSAICYINRALAHIGAGHGAQALADADRALELEPGLALALLNRGGIHYRLKHYGQALADLREAAAAGADPAVVHFQMALIYRAQHNAHAARASLEQALVLKPSYREARELYDRVRGEH